MNLTDILTPGRIKVPLSADTKAGVITELVDLLASCGDLTDRDRVLEAVLERERTRTTGIGNALAIPHGKSAGARDLVMAVGKPARPVDFESIDGRGVELVVLIVSPPEKIAAHIQALARISRLMTADNFLKTLLEAASAEQIYREIKQRESVQE